MQFFQKKEIPDIFQVESFSQEGEDIILDRIFGDRPFGYFVDVGAHHPKRFSNTYKFYRRGWRGINIDATPGSMKAFLRVRPEDINLEIPISNGEDRLTLYMFNEPALNTFSGDMARERAQMDNYRIVKEVTIQTMRLENILDQHLPARQKIQYLTVDAEGYDYQILTSNDWTRYRPEFVLFEGDPYFKRFTDSDSFQFMMSQGYEFVAKTIGTYFFKDEGR